MHFGELGRMWQEVKNWLEHHCYDLTQIGGYGEITDGCLRCQNGTRASARM